MQIDSAVVRRIASLQVQRAAPRAQPEARPTCGDASDSPWPPRHKSPAARGTWHAAHVPAAPGWFPGRLWALRSERLGRRGGGLRAVLRPFRRGHCRSLTPPPPTQPLAEREPERSRPGFPPARRRGAVAAAFLSRQSTPAAERVPTASASAAFTCLRSGREVSRSRDVLVLSRSMGWFI